MRETDITCGDCGAKLQEYDVFDGQGEVVGSHTVCPNQWRMGHPN